MAVSGGSRAEDGIRGQADELHAGQQQRCSGHGHQMQAGVTAFPKAEGDHAEQDDGEEQFQSVIRLVVIAERSPLEEMSPAGLDAGDGKRQSEDERSGLEVLC